MAEIKDSSYKCSFTTRNNDVALVLLEVGTDQPQGMGVGVYQVFVTLILNHTTIRKTKRTLSNTETSLIEKDNKSDNSNSNDNSNTLWNMADA